jgi:cytochrome c
LFGPVWAFSAVVLRLAALLKYEFEPHQYVRLVQDLRFGGGCHKRRKTIKRELLVVLAFAGGVGETWADGDVVKGEHLFKKCVACHSVTDKANKIESSLLGIVGHSAGTADGFTYSNAFKAYAEAGPTWDEKALDAWLTSPRTVIPGTKMVFPGLKEESERAARWY